MSTNDSYIGDVCEGFKAPRAHHCKKCRRCVMKLDHHVSFVLLNDLINKYFSVHG